MWGGSARAERVAVDVGREGERWGGSGELGRQWRAGSWCGEGVRELRGWQLVWGGSARNGEAIDWAGKAVEGCQWVWGGSARAERVAVGVGRE